MPSEMFEKGLKIRTEVLGEEYVNRALKGATDFNKDFQEFMTEYCWGAVWGRPGLERKQRSLNNLCMLAALNRPAEFEMHFRGALRVPAAVEAFRIGKRVMDELAAAEASGDD